LDEDKRLSAYHIAFHLQETSEHTSITHQRISQVDSFQVQSINSFCQKFILFFFVGSIEEIFVDEERLYMKTYKNNTSEIYTHELSQSDWIDENYTFFGDPEFHYRELSLNRTLAEGAYPCLEYPQQYFFQRNSDKLESYNNPGEQIQLPFKIEKDLDTEKPKILIRNHRSYVSFLSQGNFMVYTSTDIKQGKYDAHKSKKTKKRLFKVIFF